MPKLTPELVKQLRADIDAYIDATVARVKKEQSIHGLPDATIRNTLVRGNCQCASFLELEAKA
jgi:hypothetical protein